MYPKVFGGAFDAVLAVLWIVFMTNAFNLLDNMDGAASSLCAVIGGFVCLTVTVGGPGGLGTVTAAVAGACLGFLFHNRHPARIFLGDAGSLFLGFTLASAVTVVHRGSDGLSGPVVLLLATLIPTVDTALVMTSRYWESRPLLLGGTDHIAHRLRRMGITVQQAVWTLSSLAALSCLSGVLVTYGVVAPGVALLAVVVVGIAAVHLLLKVPSTTGFSRQTEVPVGALQRRSTHTTLPQRRGGTSGRRSRQNGPMEVAHIGEARKTSALSPTAGGPAASN